MAENLEITATAANLLKSALVDRIESTQEPIAQRYKAVVENVDEAGVTWVNVLGGSDKTPVVDMQITAKRGDVIDIEIENGRVKGLAATGGDAQAVTVGLLTTILGGVTGTISQSAFTEQLSAYENLYVNNFAASSALIEDLNANTVRTSNIQADLGNISRLFAQTASIQRADIDDLYARAAEILSLVAGSITAEELKATTFNAETGTMDHATIGDLTAEDATIQSLLSNHATIKDLVSDRAYIFGLLSENITVDELIAGKGEIDYADIISQQGIYAAIQNLMVRSGWFQTVEADEGYIGYLHALHIDAEDVVIENLTANKLYLRNDEDGLYYALNVTLGGLIYSELSSEMQEKVKAGFHGENIIAGTITADKIYVKDLSALNATIAGMVFGSFQFGDATYYTMHTEGKVAVNSNVPGIYVDQMGQVAIGTGSDYIMLYKDATGTWRLQINANTITIGGASLASTIQTLQDQIDNVVETWFGQGAPSLTSYPASDWIDTATRNQHIGDVYYDNDTGYAYRFTLSDGSYTWVNIPDSAVVSALEKFEGTVVEVVVEYGTGNSGTSHSDIVNWGSSRPDWADGVYVWQRTTTEYGSGTKTTAYTCIMSPETLSSSGSRSIVTIDAADLPLLTLDPVYGESVQSGTPTPSEPVPIKCVKGLEDSGGESVDGPLNVVSSTGSTTIINLKGNELHGLDDTYRDILRVDSTGHCTIEKRTQTVVFDGSEAWQNHDAGDTTKNRYAIKAESLEVPNPSGDRIALTNRTVEGYNAVWGHHAFNHDGWMLFWDNGNEYTLSSFKEWLSSNNIEAVYPLAESDWYTIDLGYVDLPEVSDGSTVYVAAEVQPVVGGTWWTKSGRESGEAWFSQLEMAKSLRAADTATNASLAKESSKLSNSITSTSNTLTNKIDGVDSKVDGVSERLDDIGDGYSEIDSRINEITQLVNELNGQMDKNTADMSGLTSIYTNLLESMGVTSALVHSYAGGVIVGQRPAQDTEGTYPSSIAAHVNNEGSFDVVEVTWTDQGLPESIKSRSASFSETGVIGNISDFHIEFNSHGMWFMEPDARIPGEDDLHLKVVASITNLSNDRQALWAQNAEIENDLIFGDWLWKETESQAMVLKWNG